MKNKVLWIMTAVSTAISAVSIGFLPDTVPMHFDMHGNADRYGSKYEMFIISAMMLILTIIWNVISAKTDTEGDSKKAVENRNNLKLMDSSMVITSLVFLGMQIMMFRTALNSDGTMPAETMNVLCLLMGFVFIFLGNLMPKSKRNKHFGLKIPWTLANDKTWAESHHFAGYAFIIGGLITAVCSIFISGTKILIIFIAVMMLVTIISIIYSYFVYKKYGKD